MTSDTNTQPQPQKENNNNNINNITNSTEQQKKQITKDELAYEKLLSLLYPVKPTFLQDVSEGTKYGLVVGAVIGIGLPLRYPRRFEPISILMKSVLNFTFLGATYSATSHILNRKFNQTNLSNHVESGMITGGITSGILGGLSQIPIGTISGGVLTGTVFFLYHLSGIERRSHEKNVQLAKYLKSNYKMELDRVDQVAFDLYVNRKSDPTSVYLSEFKDKLFSILKWLNPFKEMTEEQKEEMLKNNNAIKVNLNEPNDFMSKKTFNGFPSLKSNNLESNDKQPEPQQSPQNQSKDSNKNNNSNNGSSSSSSSS
eukprot:gene4183-5234_t